MKRSLLIGALLAGSLCKAQTNAGADLVSVDMFTGIGSVNIPVYQQSVGDLSYGVSLSYNAKGVTVDELASSVGLGWSLVAGGSITREVRSFEDEACMPVAFYSNPVNMDDTFQGMLVPGLYNHQYSAQYTKVDETQPDIFTLNLGSRTVQFAYKYNQNNATAEPVYITDPRSELKIELFTKDFVNGSYTNVRSGVKTHISEDSMKNILSFVVTDERGNKFYFERGDYERKDYEYQTDYASPVKKGVYYPTQKWNLIRAVTISGEEVVFHYISKYVENTISQTEEYDQGNSALRIEKKYWKGWKTHISKIEFPNRTEIVFDVDISASARCDCLTDFRLKNIMVRQEHDAAYKNSYTIRLNQSFFNSPTQYISAKQVAINANCSTSNWGWNFPGGMSQNDRDAEIERQLKYGIRLKLNSIDRIGTDNSTTKVDYVFDYDTMPLPHRFSASKDYFGYYNGRQAVLYPGYNETEQTWGDYYLSIPYTPGFGGGVNKRDSLLFTQANVLKKITNGLGGVTTITYKEYSLDNPSCSYGNLSTYPFVYDSIGCTIDLELEGDTVNDGLVVWKIATSDQFNQEANSVVEYDYKNGKRFFRGGYTWYGGGSSSTILTNSFLVPPNLFHGSNHGFDTAIVTVKGYNDEFISKKKYSFSNLIYYDEATSSYVSAINLPTGDKYHFAMADFKKFRMGIPLRMDVLDVNNNILATQLTRYKYISNPVEVTGFIVISGRPQHPYVPAAPDATQGIPDWPFHVIDYETLLQDSVSTTRYERNPPGPAKTFTTSSLYKYDQNNNVRAVIWSDSKGDVFKKYEGYNYHYSAGSGVTSLNSLGLQHLMSTEIWKVQGNDSLLLSYLLNVPQYDNVNHVVTYSNSYAAAISSPLTSANANNNTHINRSQALSNGASLGSDFRKIKEVTLYDEKFRALESTVPNEGIYECTIWDMEFGKPIAEVKNARHTDVAYTSFEGVYDYASNYDKGNWDFDASDIASFGGALTGKYYYKLKPGLNMMSNLNLLTARPYLLSFWLKIPGTGSNFSVGLVNSSPYSSAVLTPVLRKTVGQWKFYTIQFTPSGSNSTLTIQNIAGTGPGSDVYIDEVRLHPVEASMRTTTHKPLFGPGSACDENNQVTYFEYDAFGLLKIERDLYGNIRKKTEYVNREAATNPAAVPQTTY